MKFRLSAFESIYIALTFFTIAAWIVPALFAIFSIFSLGLLLFLPTFWIYTTAMLPGHILGRWLGRPELKVLVAIPIWGIIAFLPAFIGYQQSKSELLTLQRDDIVNAMPKEVAHLIFRNIGFYYQSAKHSPLVNAPCDAVCQRLLVSGAASKITVAARFRNENPDVAVEYEIVSMAICPKALEKTSDATQELIAAAAQGRCLVSSVKALPNDGVVISTEKRDNRRNFDRALWSYMEGETRTVSTRTNGEESINYRRTSFELSSIQAPLMVSLYGGFYTTVQGWKVARLERGFTAKPIEIFLRDELKLKVNSYSKDAKAASVRRKFFLTEGDIRNILAKDTKLPIDPLLIQPINDWATTTFPMGQKYDANRASLLTTLIEEPRMTSLHGIGWTLGHHHELAKQNLRPILKRLSSQPSGFRDNSADMLGNSLSIVDGITLSAEDKATLLSMFSEGVSENNKGVLKLLAKQPRLGVDVIRKELNDLSSNYRGLAIEAACLVDKSDYVSLAQPVRKNIYSHYQRSYPPTAFRTIVLQEGIRQAEEAIKELDKKEVERLSSYGERILTLGKAECL
jgi:hypothetical protein